MTSSIEDETDTVTKWSPHSVTETVESFLRILEAKGLTLFAVIDQRDEALRVGLDLRETTLILFGNPTTGTPVMDASPLAALDLPLKVLIWSDGSQTNVTYLKPTALASRHNLSRELGDSLSGIDGLTDQLIAE
jgi:uncharacterized protein (DUF302 family)